MHAQKLLERIQSRDAVIGVLGLGYVGLPLALAFARAGFRVKGFDIDAHKIAALSRGHSYIHHIAHHDLAHWVNAGKLVPTASFEPIADCQALIICVPTPLTPQREPDMRYVEQTAKTIAPYLSQGALVVLESTTYPGTTEGLLRTLLEKGSGKKAGHDFFLAFSPEREDPGNTHVDAKQVPKLVAGLTQVCSELTQALYLTIRQHIVLVSSLCIAEMAKLLENTFRSVNIALVNEFKIVCDAMGIDVWEVIEAAATKPFGFMPFYPGPGIGGHCIPVDPFYLAWKAREYAVQTRFIELSGEVNASMPDYVVKRLSAALSNQGKALHTSRVLLLGVAYKANVDDVREAPALEILARLIQHGVKVNYHDAFVPHLPRVRRHAFALQSVPLTKQVLEEQDAVLIVTAHNEIDYAFVVEHARLVIDTRNATRDVSHHRERIIKA